MNAHAHPKSFLGTVDLKKAREALDDLEGVLDQIGALANAATTVCEHQLGAGPGARELTVLASLIEEIAQRGQVVRSDGFAALQGVE